MFAKGPVHPLKMYRLEQSLREQVRSYSLRPESKSGLCMMRSVGTRVHTLLPGHLAQHSQAAHAPVRKYVQADMGDRADGADLLGELVFGVHGQLLAW